MNKSTLTRSIALACAILSLNASAAPSTISVTPPAASKGKYSDRIVATWSANAYANNGYNVYRTPTSEYRNPIKLGKTTNLFWVDRTAQPGRKYWYWIAPIYKYATYSYYYTYRGRTLYRVRRTTWNYVWYPPTTGTSGQTAQGGYRAVTIPKPTVSRGKSTTTLYLSWTSSPQALYGYRVYRSTSSSFSSAVSLGTTYNRYWHDTTAYPGRTYYYWVSPRCFNFTPYNASKYGCGWLALGVPYTEGYQNGNSVYLYWDSIYGAQYYEIYRGTSPEINNASYVGYTYNTYWTDYDVVSGRRYYWWIAPVDVEGYIWSNNNKYGTLIVQ